MSFLYPAFLFGAMAAAIPIVLHLLQRRPEPRVPFTAVRFLAQVPVEHARRRRLRELLLLALRVAAVVLLAGSFARPYVDRATAASGPPTLVAVDTSFSMSGAGRFDRAKQLAREAIRRAPGGGALGVIAFSDSAEVVAEPILDRGAALAAVEALHAGYGATRYRPAFERAAEVLGTRRGRLVVITDLQRNGWSDVMPIETGIAPGVTVDVVDIGPPPGNLVVAGLRRDDRGVTAVVHNTGSLAQSSRARLAIDGRAAGEVALSLAPGSSTEARFAASVAARGEASVAIDDALGFTADDTRYLVLDPPAPPLVLAITASGNAAEAFYLQRALLVDAPTRFRWDAVSAEQVSARAGDLDGCSGVILLGTRGLDRRGREALSAFVRRGGGLLVAAGADVDPAMLEGLLGGVSVAIRLAAEEESLTLAGADARHPVIRPLGRWADNLGQIRFRHAAVIEEKPDLRVVARFSTGTPAIAEARVGAGRVLVFASDLNNRWNDLPLHPTFVPLVHEMVRYLAAGHEQPAEYLIGQAPASAGGKPGIVTIETASGGGGAGRATQRVAVNVDLKESDAARMSLGEFIAAIPRATPAPGTPVRSEARRQEDEQRLWRYGLLLMCAALAAEGILGRRTG